MEVAAANAIAALVFGTELFFGFCRCLGNCRGILRGFGPLSKCHGSCVAGTFNESFLRFTSRAGFVAEAPDEAEAANLKEPEAPFPLVCLEPLYQHRLPSWLRDIFL